MIQKSGDEEKPLANLVRVWLELTDSFNGRRDATLWLAFGHIAHEWLLSVASFSVRASEQFVMRVVQNLGGDAFSVVFFQLQVVTH